MGCLSDSSRCNAQTQSNYPFCDQPCSCAKVQTLSSKLDYLDSLHPGFTTRYSGGKIEISSVIPGSPAEIAGIRPGDEIVRINGKQPTALPCGSQTWESGSSPRSSVVTLRRAGIEWDQTIPLTAARTILASLWRGEEGPFRAVSLREGGHPFRPPDSYGPYTTGLIGERRGAYFIVSAVLYGSPAELAGVLPGDRIVFVNGISIPDATEAFLSHMWAADQRLSFRVTIQRRGITVTKVLLGEALTAILRAPSSAPGARPVQSAAGAPGN